MAYYAALVSLIESLKEINNLGYPYSIYLPKRKLQIQASLSETLNHLQKLLEDYSPKDKAAADYLERRIRDATHQALDLIELHISNTTHRAEDIIELDVPDAGYQGEDIIQSHTPNHIPQRHGLEKIIHVVKIAFWQLISAFQRTKPLQVHEELQKLKEEFDSIVEELMRIKVEINRAREEDLQLNSYVSESTIIEASKVQAPSGRSTMVGFEELLMTIKDQLCGQSSKREVVSIVGMGGLGKTTLARNIFDDKLIHDHFDCHVWVTVSQNYHLQNILLSIVSSLNMYEGLHGAREEVLRELIYKHFKGRRYFIILDDIWDTKVWDNVRRIFPDDGNGSRVILTTRLLDVATYADSLEFLHHMQFLNEDQSWILFREKVFCPPELEDIGRLIARNCRGLPLAIVVVAGLLSKANTTRYDWKKIARGVSSTAAENDEHFSRILSLSYNHLPHHLKPCFLYLGGFPEDYEISVSKLIKLWVAEGFLKPTENKSFEEVAEEYLEDLVSRNLVLITRRRSNGKFRWCNIHDLLRDLCSERARCENFLHFSSKNDDFHLEAIKNVHRLYIHPYSSFPQLKEEYVCHLRSILFFHYTWYHFLSDASSFKLLRVLDAPSVELSSFPAEILELLQLRYLALLRRQFTISSLIFELQNLQTLILVSPQSHFSQCISLPSEIWKMPHLRHVMIKRMIFPPIPYDGRIIDGVPLLGMLQTLGTVVDFTFTDYTIEMIPNLKKLKVEFMNYSPFENAWEKFGLKNFIHLHQLETLYIESSRGSGPYEQFVEPLPENFAFSSTLKKLSLKRCRLPWKDMRAVGLLPNLQILKLRCNTFVGEEWEPTEGEFLNLKFLLLESLDDIKYWRAEKTHFPRLEQLHIKHCRQLEKIPSEVGDIPTLQLIELEDCNSALDASALEIQEEQQDLGNDILKIHIR